MFLLCFYSILIAESWEQLHQYSPLSHYNCALHQHSTCPISDVIGPMLSWSSPQSSVIDVFLQDVGAEVLGLDDTTKVFQFWLFMVMINYLSVSISFRTNFFVLWSAGALYHVVSKDIYCSWFKAVKWGGKVGLRSHKCPLSSIVQAHCVLFIAPTLSLCNH